MYLVDEFIINGEKTTNKAFKTNDISKIDENIKKFFKSYLKNVKSTEKHIFIKYRIYELTHNEELVMTNIKLIKHMSIDNITKKLIVNEIKDKKSMNWKKELDVEIKIYRVKLDKYKFEFDIAIATKKGITNINGKKIKQSKWYGDIIKEKDRIKLHQLIYPKDKDPIILELNIGNAKYTPHDIHEIEFIEEPQFSYLR